MKKLLKSYDKKIISVLLIIMLLLSTVAVYKIYATITNESDSRGREENAPGTGKYYTYSDLVNLYEILCCYHGGSDSVLPGGSPSLNAGGTSTTTTDGGKDIGELTPDDVGKETALSVNSYYSSSPYTNKEKVNSKAFYTIDSTEIAQPKEAYILAEMIEEVDGGTVFYDTGFSEIQYAWWTTVAGSNGPGRENDPDNIPLQDEAEAFEAYMREITGKNIDEKFVEEDFAEQDYQFEKDGVVHSGTVTAPVITAKPSYIKDLNRDGVEDEKDKVTVSWDSDKQTWTVGPFILDYVESSSSTGVRPDVQFAGITNAELYTNLGKVDKTKWRFNFIDGERERADRFEFPHKEEKFYVEIDFIEGATKVTNLHFDFKYMNAGGKFDSLQGIYFNEEWTPKSEVIETCPGPTGYDDYCIHGYSYSHNVMWKHYLKLTGMQQKTAQLLAYGIIGARWYQNLGLDIETDVDTNEHEGSFKIYKEIVDKDGNVLTNIDKNKKFTFEIYKDGTFYNKVYVSTNKPYTSPVYKWKDGENAPVFTVKEVLEDTDDYKQYGDIKVEGSLEDKTLKFTAQNYQEEHSGKISIEKRQIGTGLENMEFSFKLYIDNKVYVDPQKTAEDGTITVKVGDTWTSNDITWTGKTGPKYKVSEINLPDDAILVGLQNDTGVLVKDTVANVIAINSSDKKYEQGTITIKKEITTDRTTNEEFTFIVRIGNDRFTKVLKAGESWTETFTWEKGTPAPDYEVDEINIPSNWKLVEIKNKEGILSANSNIDIIATNEENEKTASIDITKHTISNSQTDEEFTIVCDIKGTFKIGDEEIVDGTKTIETKLKAEQTVTLGPITWNGEAPSYEVTETNIPEGWNLQDITNKSGKFEDGKKVEVLCTNYKDIKHEGSFKIYKEIVDKEGKVLTNTDKDKEFTFEIYKDGNYEKPYDTVNVSVNKPYNSPVYKWKDGEKAPEFTVKEILDENGNYKLFEEINVEGSLEQKTLKFTAKNYKEEEKPKSGSVSIKKEQIGTGLENMEFSFKLYINDEVYIDSGKTSEDGTIKLKVDQTWTSNEITWTGDKAPSYRIEEINLPKNSKIVNIENGSGTLLDRETVNVVAKNEKNVEYEKGSISLTKNAEGQTDDTFTFKVRVGKDTFAKTLKSGQTWTEEFEWEKGTEAPDYEVEEVDIPESWKLVEIKNQKGRLSNDTKIDVVAINTTDEKSGTIKLHKETISDDKEGIDENEDVFTLVTTISGTFEIGQESIVNGSKTITKELKSGDTVTLDTVRWKGDVAPTYVVKETSLPEGWKLKEITNESGSLEENKTIEVICTNEYKIKNEYELTMEMAGKVWEDVALKPEDKNTVDSKPNGKYDAGLEQGIEKVEVVIWKKCYDSNGNEITSLRKMATGYEEGNDTIIDFPIYTSIDGLWEAPRMAVPGLTDSEKENGAVKADYDVEFTYDGQTYKPTDFLVSGNVEHFKKATNAVKSQYLNDSMAYEVEEERARFDSRFETISGDTPIDDNGQTVGYAIDQSGEKRSLEYYSTDSMPTVEGNTRKISELQTLDNENYIRNQFKMSSRTSTGGLTYPFDDKVHLVNVKRIIDKIEGGLIIRYEYSATYPYLLNVNLGLVRRDEAELAITKDVYSAAVTVNQKLLNYKFNEYVDFESEKYRDYLDLQLKVQDANIAYKLDLYESDYYYRATVYDSNTELKGALQEFYRTLNKTNLSEELDLDAFLTYKISVYNQSDSYLAKVKSIVDYFDEDLELVNTDITRYVQEADGNIVDGETVVAKPAYIIKKGATSDSTWAEQLNRTIADKVNSDYSKKYVSSSDINAQLSNSSEMTVSNNVKAENSKSYYKATIDLDDDSYKLAAGEKLEIYLTFKVRTDEAPAIFAGSPSDAVNSYVRLGTKANIAEIGSYSTYYHDTGKVAGKVDKDSAPNNTDIENKNEKSWYEDDTDSAPIITLDLYNETREVNGFAWEDNQTEKISYNQVIGNGIYDEGERLIGNLTTAIVEKVTVKQADGTYKDYDFVWPTDKVFDFLGNRTLEQITGFDSITLTSNKPEDTGSYKFTNIPAGNYVVRFIYGHFPTDKFDDAGMPIKLDGVSEPKTSDSGDRLPAVYNGQDFKSTAYQSDIIESNGKSYYSDNASGYIDNEWYDFTTVKYDEAGNILNHNSDVMDNEARRLEVIAYSKVLDNTITTVLATANDYNADHTELYNNTAMFADTAKINLNIENMNKLKGQKIVVTDEVSGNTKEIIAGDTETRNNILTNTVIGKSDVNGRKGTVSIVDYNYKIEAIDAGLEERSNTEFVLDKEIESITLTTNTNDPILEAYFDIDYEFDIDEATGKSICKPKVELNKDKSYGTENLMYQNKDEINGLQNFRYINYDDTISQGLNLKVVYRLSMLNIGEVDRTGKVAQLQTSEQLKAEAQKLKEQTYIKVGNKLVNKNHSSVGEYLGSIYYLGERGSYSQPDSIVETKAIQLIDYVDNDAVFKADENNASNSSWKSVTADELLAKNVINSSIIENDNGVNTIFDDKGVAYTTAERNNLILSVDSIEGDKLSNPGFIVQLVPYSASKENSDTTDKSCLTSMNLVITRSIDTEIDSTDLSYDNIAELVRYENTVGKRDIKTISGNADPKGGILGDGEFASALAERDSSATELITFTPPTGLGIQTSLKIEILLVSLVGLTILTTGVVLIKKYVIK